MPWPFSSSKADQEHSSDEKVSPENRARRMRWKRWALLLLLLLLSYCSAEYLRNSYAATITISLPLSQETQEILGDGTYTNIPNVVIGEDGSVQPVTGGTSGRAGVASTPTPSQPAPSGTTPAAGGTAGAGASPADTSGATPTDGGAGTATGAPSGPGGTGAAVASVSSTPRGTRGTSGIDTPPSTGVTLPGRGPDAGPDDISLQVLLIHDDGTVIEPLYHIKSGTAQLVIDERRFRPGLYTLRIIATNTITNASDTTDQEFGWGVLALNAEKDRYMTGATVNVDIGVLDELGAIVCDADLTLGVIAPSGRQTVLSTEDGKIEITGTCGLKQPGLISPDYEASFTVDEVGVYQLKLTSQQGLQTFTLDTDLTVEPAHKTMVITREAATRLWPLAPSTMQITVDFYSDFTGTIADVVPDGFLIIQTTPNAQVTAGPLPGDRSITWTGSWQEGESVTLGYVYDAPDISPEFYLAGPLKLTSTGGTFQELRTWQIANDDVAASTNYKIERDVVPAGGGELAMSNNYLLSDTIGEPAVGPGRSANYQLQAGYRQVTAGTTLSLNCSITEQLGDLVFTGQTTGSGSCTVISDFNGGYSLSWSVLTGSGGSSTGYLISQLEDTIGPFSVATPGTPESWSVPASAAEWGGRLRSSSTDTDAKWGTDGGSENWLNISTGSYVIVTRSSPTEPAGSLEHIQFRAEIGSSVIQPTGKYQATITFTAAAL